MFRRFMYNIPILLMLTAFPVYALESDANQQDTFAQEVATPDFVMDEETNKPVVLNDPNKAKIDNSEQEHSVSDETLYEE